MAPTQVRVVSFAQCRAQTTPRLPQKVQNLPRQHGHPQRLLPWGNSPPGARKLQIPQNKKNIELNNRYNECLVKSNIRMLIFCYITISLDTSTDSTQETEYINELVDKCYTNNDNTILINLYNNQKAIETYLQFASQVIKTLENESSLKKLDENEQKALLALYMHYFAPKTPSNNKQ